MNNNRGELILIDFIIRVYKYAQINYLFWKKEFSSKLKPSFFEWLSMVTKGFHGETKFIYNLSENNPSSYLSDYNRLKTKFINKNSAAILNNKISFERTLKDYVDVPKTLAVVTNGKIIKIDDENGIEDLKTLCNYLDRETHAVLKPIGGGGGEGINILKKINNDVYINGKVSTLDELSNKIKTLDDYFISEFINQGSFPTNLYPDTLNSMRIVTMIDPDTSKAFIPIAVQRIGTLVSSPADNWTQGGLSSEIDVDTGLLSKGASYPFKRKVEWHSAHPETGSIIEGKRIPEWDYVKDSILEAANKHPYIKYIGWDVVSTVNGLMVIEGNNYSDMNLLQIHRPLLKDDRVKRFYQYHNII